jgi:ATP-dependent DNA helicase RecG
MITLSTEIDKISRVGVATAKKLKKIGINTISDLLLYFPFRYDDFSQISKISELQNGQSANIVGQIELLNNKRSPRKRMMITEALVNDETETIKVIWFNQPYIGKTLKAGDHISLSGKVEDDYSGLTMISPTYEKIFNRTGTNVHTQGFVPNYHLTANLTQKQIRFLIKQVINYAREIIDWLPAETKKEARLIDLPEAIKKIHFPKNQAEIDQAQKRLAFQELFLLQMQSQIARKEAVQCVSAAIKFKEKETKGLVDSLPFKLTNAQRKAAWEIIKDLEKNKPMSRLLEGDVGSGKTIVAILAMYNVALNGYQSVLMVPTEILAQQHFTSISRLLESTGVKVGLITSGEKRTNCETIDDRQPDSQIDERRANYLPATASRALQAGKLPKLTSQFIIENSQIIIGTHALIQEKIEFKNLAFAIIDEQHRFGVDQRKTLIEKSVGLKPKTSNLKPRVPHFLSMTATPIPRSLALALYGDLDVSIINEMPKNRKTVATQIIPEEKRQVAYNFIREQIKTGRQVFVICPLIDFSDKLGVKSVKEEFEKLDKLIFPEITMAMLHGKMKSAEKENIMNDFLANKTKILVSTSVIEVGVDIPNATIMMIEGADRFGLAQLHQFRGRVGRSDHQSYCFLFTEAKNEKTVTRLKALEKYHDGFTLAKIDLKFRGPGEVFGTSQSGFPELKIASLFDYELVKQTGEAVQKIIKKDPELNSWPLLKIQIDLDKQVKHLD